MALEMRPNCESCGAPTPPTRLALICSFECTFCAACGARMDDICPNCGGELVLRPRRFPEPGEAHRP